MTAMLRAAGVQVGDWPKPFRYAHPDWAHMARVFVPFIETLMPDTEAWEALTTEDKRLELWKVVLRDRAARPGQDPEVVKACRKALRGCRGMVAPTSRSASGDDDRKGP